MVESFFKNLPPDSLRYLVISQAVLLGVFIVQKFIEWFFVGFRTAKVRERKKLEEAQRAAAEKARLRDEHLDHELKQIRDRLHSLANSVAGIAGQVNLWTELFKLPQVQEKMSGIAAKLRTDP